MGTTTNTYTGEERRRSPRTAGRFPVKYYKFTEGAAAGTDDAVMNSSYSTDLSTGGIRLTSHKFIPISHRLVLEIDLPGCTAPLKAVAKVAWIRKGRAEGDFELGAHFLEVSKKNMVLITKYLDRFAAPQGNIPENERPLTIRLQEIARNGLELELGGKKLRIRII